MSQQATCVAAKKRKYAWCTPSTHFALARISERPRAGHAAMFALEASLFLCAAGALEPVADPTVASLVATQAATALGNRSVGIVWLDTPEALDVLESAKDALNFTGMDKLRVVVRRAGSPESGLHRDGLPGPDPADVVVVWLAPAGGGLRTEGGTVDVKAGQGARFPDSFVHGSPAVPAGGPPRVIAQYVIPPTGIAAKSVRVRRDTEAICDACKSGYLGDDWWSYLSAKPAWVPDGAIITDNAGHTEGIKCADIGAVDIPNIQENCEQGTFVFTEEDKTTVTKQGRWGPEFNGGPDRCNIEHGRFMMTGMLCGCPASCLPSTSDSKLSTEAIVGIVLGCTVIVGIAVVAARKLRNRSETALVAGPLLQ